MEPLHVKIDHKIMVEKSIPDRGQFLYSCYRKFLHQSYGYSIPQNLIMMWESDYTKLMERLKANESK